MFTGLIEETGRVLALTQNAATGVWSLKIGTQKIADGTDTGDSVAVNGCCLTVTGRDGTALTFDVLDETLRKTSFRLLRVGLAVNLERSLTPTSRMGGHFVSGHVDGTGEVLFFAADGANHRLRVRPSAEFLKYLAYKGSVAVDGISLTVAAVDDVAGVFDIWLIPHTLEATNLHERGVGDPVNLEFDLLAKYVERVAARQRD
ncbi:MAG: riboflavin synthase [Puniceicoccales bacterium]|jgi:riboflavin synthase|nr:riboflavin synthase [Puniceicoccales bacterium]